MWVTKRKSKIFSDHTLITLESIYYIGESSNHLSIEKIVFELIFLHFMYLKQLWILLITNAILNMKGKQKTLEKIIFAPKNIKLGT